TGATTSSIEVTTPGTYSVTVTDSGGCTGEEQITVETAPGPQPEITGPAGVCGGGLATLEIAGNYSSIMWSTGETGTSINAAPGTYSVTVTNTTGCPGTDAFEVTTFAPASVEINGPSSICSGSAGMLGVAGAFSEMIWNTGATTPEIEVNAAGTYSVTVTDANGCTAIDSMTVEAGTALTPEVIQTGAPCVDTAVLDAGAGYDTYTWSNGMTTPTITVDASGMYFVTVTDASGCTGIAEAEVNLQEPVEVEITGPPSVCGTETAMLAATSGFASYAWSTGDTTASIMVGQTGIYQVVVTDTNGCTGETSIAFTVFEDPDPVISGPASICTGSDAVLGVGGTYSSIVWSTGATTPEITVSGSGSFAVTVTDANGCTGTETHTVQIADSLSLDINVSGPLCEGTAILSAGGGFASYVWSNGATTPEITVNDEGIYGVTVTDAGGCSGQASLALTMPDPVDVEILGPVNACAGADATLLASASQGQFLWSTGDTTAAIQVSASGNYSVTVTGDGGCTAEASTTFEILPPPSIVVNGPDFICTGYPGTLTIDSAYVEMQWSTGDTGDSMLVETGGLYSVTVTDANGCTAVAEHLVTSGLSDSTFLEMETCSVLDTGTVQYIMTSQSGCDSVITIHMMLAPSLSSEVSLTACAGESIQYDDVEVLAGESAEILYVASTGCDSIVTVIVSELPAVMIETEITPACADAEDGTIAVLMVQGTAPFEFWIDGQPADAGSLLTGLAAGSHLISVVDANGCSLEMPVEIPERARVEIAVEDQVLTCASPMAVLSPTVVGGNAGDVQWFWSTGVAQHWIAVEEPGTYSVSVDDGCGIQAYTINVTSAGDGPDGKLFYVPNAFSPNGDGVNDEFRAFPNPDYTVLDFELRIFDRWGNTLFTASDTEASWDGLFRNLAMEPGVYVWWLKATVDLCGQRQRYVMERGDVTVLR
ncbi:MAG: gliding motility-associated C-terminal domain-containing protein, partial [Saprospiraceae bacterium]|nr:gliding motility-associated C-terminal domain-containing protein [Saprospiraceae bacterium]